MAAVRVASDVELTPRDVDLIPLMNFVPATATAVAINVTLSGVTSPTFVSVCAVDETVTECSQTSAVNAVPGRDVANLVFPQISADRTVKIYNNQGSVIVNIDLVGYFSTDDGTLDYAPITPTRDSEEPVIGPGQTRFVNLNNVMAGASAVAVRLTTAGVTSNTYISGCEATATVAECAVTSSVNPRQRDTSNLTIVPISAATGNRIQVYNNQGSTIVRTDVVGWFVPQGQGSRYVAIAPVRVLEALDLGEGRDATRAYASQIPVGATGVAANITTAGNTAVSYVSVCPGGTSVDGCKTTSAVNPYPGTDTGSSTLVRIGTGRNLLYYNNRGRTFVSTDLQGYFVPSNP